MDGVDEPDAVNGVVDGHEARPVAVLCLTIDQYGGTGEAGFFTCLLPTQEPKAGDLGERVTLPRIDQHAKRAAAALEVIA